MEIYRYSCGFCEGGGLLQFFELDAASGNIIFFCHVCRAFLKQKDLEPIIPVEEKIASLKKSLASLEDKG